MNSSWIRHYCVYKARKNLRDIFNSWSWKYHHQLNNTLEKWRNENSNTVQVKNSLCFINLFIIYKNAHSKFYDTISRATWKADIRALSWIFSLVPAERWSLKTNRICKLQPINHSKHIVVCNIIFLSKFKVKLSTNIKYNS